MFKRRLGLSLLVLLILSLALSALPACAISLRWIGGSTAGQPRFSWPTSAVQTKNTTRLKPPKFIKVHIDEVKRVPLKLKYKIQPDPINIVMDRTDRIMTFVHNSNLFVVGTDTGDTVLAMTSGTKSVTTIVSTLDMPITGMRLAGNLLQTTRFSIANLNEALVPATAASFVKWSSDKPDVVRVTASGGLTCRKVGNAVVSCRLKKGNILIGSILVIVE